MHTYLCIHDVCVYVWHYAFHLQLLGDGFQGLACLHVVQARDDEVDSTNRQRNI